METSYLVMCDEATPLERLFQDCDDGHLGFGHAGQSIEMASAKELLCSEVCFRGYVMEGFVRYFATARETENGLLLTIRMTGSNRDQHLDWLIGQHIKASGCSASRVAA